MSGFLNIMVTACREKKPIQQKSAEPSKLELMKQELLEETMKKERLLSEYNELADGTFSQIESEKQTCEEKIRQTIRKKPKWILDVKKGIIPDRKVLMEIMNAAMWLNCDIKPTIKDCRKILQEESDLFDMEAFKKQGEVNGT